MKAYLNAVKYNPSLQASWLGILGLENASEDIIKVADKNIIYLKNLPPELKSVLSFIHEGKLKKLMIFVDIIYKIHLIILRE